MLLAIAGNSVSSVTTNDSMSLKKREQLVFRLGSEWYKIGLLKRDLTFISNILEDLRNLELFPLSCTGLDEKELINFDKQIEKVEIVNSIFNKEINGLKQPLSDALSITREMVTGEPVESMFEVLEDGDLKRIDNMIRIKRGIDKNFKSIDTLLSFLFQNAGLRDSSKTTATAFDNEFFEILKSNLGQTANDYFAKLNTLKIHYLSKADSTQTMEMFKIERHHLTETIKKKSYEAALRNAEELIVRYENSIDIDEIRLLVAQLHTVKEDYLKVLEDISKISETKLHSQKITHYRFQALYALGRYNDIIDLSAETDFSTISESSRNLLIWITLESVTALQMLDFSPSTLITGLVRNQPYSLHVMHALSKFFLAKKDTSTAMSVLLNTHTYQAITYEDERARERIDLSIAWINYQNKKYDDALAQFYQLLKKESLYEDALTGILWCYIKTNQNEKADAALKKLINQSPQSALAAEGILILAGRYLDKAISSWKKSVYLSNEESRLENMFMRLEQKFSNDSLNEQYQTYIIAREELKTLKQRIKQEPRASYEQIFSYYEQIEKVCNLIIHHYKSGTFQETSFSREREKILFYLDSILIKINSDESFSFSKKELSRSLKNRASIKAVVDRALLFSAVSSIDKYRWEKEYYDYKKTELSKKIQQLSSTVSRSHDSVQSVELMKDSLNRNMNTILIDEEKIHNYYYTYLSEKLKVLINANIDFNEKAYFLYHLGELAYSRENQTFSKAYEAYEATYSDYTDSLKNFRNGSLLAMPVEPAAPSLNHDSSISYFTSVITLPQPTEYLHAAQYSLAWCYNDLGLIDSALNRFHAVALDYPSSPHAPQSWMYCGEYFFDKAKLDTAISCYHAVMRYPESKWFDEALYKQAWAQYRLSNPEKAISSFLALVDLGDGNMSGKSLLEKESMDYIAISFSETDPTGSKGLDRAVAFANRINDNSKSCRILQRLASVYNDQGRYDMSRKTLETILKMNPEYSGNPQVDYSLITLTERDESPLEVNQKKFEFYKKYTLHSKWTSSQKDSAFRARTDSLAERMLYSCAIGFHQLALQKSDTEHYKDALNAYKEYIRTYPGKSSANECHYNLAEIQFSIGNYKEAAEEYIAVSKRYPESKYKETAAWNAIVASQNYLKQESSTK
ncbi:MAG: tetratricopeptide repeat protein [Chitinispirillaceae bacterium]|nr:tetratricopeptide repeat protein [Chitinispirillaceae bacterium]